jgi:hypothetical protein
MPEVPVQLLVPRKARMEELIGKDYYHNASLTLGAACHGDPICQQWGSLLAHQHTSTPAHADPWATTKQGPLPFALTCVE